MSNGNDDERPAVFEGAKAYADIANSDEDERIKIIGEYVMTQRNTARVVTDDVPPEKAERYQRKLRERFPGIVLGPIMPTGVKGSVFFNAGPPAKTA